MLALRPACLGAIVIESRLNCLVPWEDSGELPGICVLSYDVCKICGGWFESEEESVAASCIYTQIFLLATQQCPHPNT